MNPQERKRQNLTAIYEALLHLMSHKPLSMISITELCAHAQLSRSYFYRNFTSFDQIIVTYQEQAILTYFRRLPRQSKITLPVLMTQYFTFMQQMATTNQLLIDNGKAQIIVQTFEAAYTLLIRHDRIITVTDSTIHHQPYYIAFFLAQSSTFSFTGNRPAWSNHPAISPNKSSASPPVIPVTT